ncbi:src kinase-associated phosphoprotein 1 isoform 1-T1 [Discoglossus pictus]
MQSRDLLRDVLSLLTGAESYLAETLQNESLSMRAKEQRDELLHSILHIRNRYPLEFQQKGGEAGNLYLDDSLNPVSDDVSFTSDNQDEDSEEEQKMERVLKQGYLEKRNRGNMSLLQITVSLGLNGRKDGVCLLREASVTIQVTKPKGGFLIDEYTALLVSNIRKDSRRDACFELVSPDKRSYQFTAASPMEARDWVEQIQFLVKDIMSPNIPFEDDEEPYDDVDSSDSSVMVLRPPPLDVENSLQDDDIYEELPDEEITEESEDLKGTNCQIIAGGLVCNYENYYQGLWNCKRDNNDELSFQRGDLIHILSKEYDAYGWWVGEMDGMVGIVPKEFLTDAFDL